MENINKGGQFLLSSSSLEKIFTPEDLTNAHKAISRSLKEFIAGEIHSRGDEVENLSYELNRELMKKAGDLGFLEADVPEEYGGMELDKVSSLIISEILGEGSGSFSITELNHTGIGTLPLTFFGNDEQRKKYIPGLSSGELIGSFGLTEPEAGSDALNSQTTAELSEDGRYYIINGTKIFITNAGFADLIFVFAKVGGKAFTCFIVEFNIEGVSTDREEVKMGMKGTSTRSVIFNNVHVPVENVLGEVGKGHVIALNALNMGRFKLGAVCIGSARNTFNEAVKYAKKRIQFGKPICEFGMIKEKISEMAIRLFAGQSMMYRTAGAMDQMINSGYMNEKDIGLRTAKVLEEYLIECSIMKIFGSETQGYVADESLQIFGGYGYIYKNPAEMAYRNARINRIWEGTNEINRLTIINTFLKRKIIENAGLMTICNESVDKMDNIKPVIYDDPANLSAQEKMLDIAKKSTLFLIVEALNKYGSDFRKQQEIISLLSNMFIEIYALESACLRTKKISISKISPNHLSTAINMTKVLSYDSFVKLSSLALKALIEIKESDSFEREFSMLRSLLCPPRINTITIRRRIAEACIQKGGVVL